MDITSLHQVFCNSSGISTDSRKIKKGSLFFALTGENFNGNKFAADALKKGADYAVVDDPAVVSSDKFILVSDVLEALQQLARFHREQLSIPIIGLTGTNGKTTTKELIFAVLSQKYKVHATQGNLNNHIGVPLTLLEIDADVEIAVIEMGANHQEEIKFLCSLARPDIGLITNVGKAHLEGFGSFEGVKKAKGELYEFLGEHGGKILVQGDNAYLHAMLKDRALQPFLRYGEGLENDLVGTLVDSAGFLSFKWYERSQEKKYLVNTRIVGSYNLDNALAAILLGRICKIEADQINQALAGYIPQNNRSQLSKTDFNTVICDFYNANVSSMKAAVENLSRVKAESKVVILGDMFELGAYSDQEHQKIVDLTREINAERRIFVGDAFYGRKDSTGEFYRTTQEAKNAISQNPVKNATVLLKASRSMKFEELLSYL
ncbi:MAG TPA: UDP-N-acetylmuramoyl-tripeptide--D-alanyl-D-alanine ligase [Candidatus Sphingobacterium stercoripullorum]|nr:UDP-N-acetylmuramoyl-tripeptide--D-alanyl-D-alanine ligase [Candidatus Sphingobacterium stercoripullorum]